MSDEEYREKLIFEMIDGQHPSMPWSELLPDERQIMNSVHVMFHQYQTKHMNLKLGWCPTSDECGNMSFGGGSCVKCIEYGISLFTGKMMAKRIHSAVKQKCDDDLRKKDEEYQRLATC